MEVYQHLTKFKSLIQKEKSVLIEKLWDAPKALLASITYETTNKNILIITGEAHEEDRLFDDICHFHKEQILEFPAWETLPSENLPPSPDVVGERYTVLKELLDNKKPKIILSNLQACLQKLIPPKTFSELCIELSLNKEFPFTELQHKLLKMGYLRRPLAVEKGEFAVRGGLIDVFPVSLPEPIRIEFWGDEIDSMRIYDPIGQKSIGKISDVFITPARELELLKEEETLSSFGEYLDNTVIVFDNLLAIEDKKAFLESIPGTISETFDDFETFSKIIEKQQKIYFSPQHIELPQTTLWEHPFQKLRTLINPEGLPDLEYGVEEFILGIIQLPQKLQFLCNNETEEEHLKEHLNSLEISLPKKTKFLQGYLSSGFGIEDIVVVPYAEIFQHYKRRRQKRRGTYHGTPLNFIDLEYGDIVVHINHGIGKYLSIETHLNHLGIDTEFLSIQYDGGAKLYVPLTQSHLVSKYIGSREEGAPKLHTLGGKRWKRTRSIAEYAIKDYAAQILQIYAERTISGGYAFPQCSKDNIQFEKDFPYEETYDQLNAINAIKEDMMLEKPMDRLICGDVGYGKTEVAMRAAFKAVIDGSKQVAVLVPTTILAMQHFDTFLERMEPYPVVIKALSRFQTPKETKKIIEGVSKGSVDILIGTHRILSSDVIFKDLGLIIIDEEQRFGVRSKEKLKTDKTGVDCLTLTATPIPRTLYLSLAGARDMSPINTPPQDRIPIKTIVTPSKNDTIKNAILRELSRNGQTFIIHNRVESIHSFASKIAKLVPQARILVGHGRMSPHEIDDIFHEFQHGNADILIATTILENGVDVPNANTIIVDRADRFGLADLYQLRGRVGRWNRQAYAYFLIPSTGSLSVIAEKRLDVLKDLSGYGGGMKLALRDLEIRGSGDILGTEQSGQISNIGFHLYCKLLQRAISSLQGKTPPPLQETKIEFPYDARITEEYINEPTLRMNVYQRFGEANSNEEIKIILDEIKDRFGKPTEEVMWLYHLMRIRVFAAKYSIFSLKMKNDKLHIQQHTKQGVINKIIPITKSKDPKSLESNIIKALHKTVNSP